MADLPNDAAPGVNQGAECYTKSVKYLAETLHVSRPTIYAWLEIDGCPGKTDEGSFCIPAWQDFAKAIGSKTAAGCTEDKSLLQAEELRVVIDSKKFALAVKQGEYTHNSQIGAQITELVQEAKTVLLAKFERELPPKYTGDPAKDRTLNRAAIDEVCERLSRPLPCQEAALDA